MALRALHAPHGSAPRPQASGRNFDFVLLFLLTVSARSLLLTTFPLTALRVLGDAQDVSLLYLVSSLLSVSISLSLPLLLGRWPRGAVLALGALCSALGPLLFATETVPGLVLGLGIQIAGVAIIEIALNLYVLDRLPRRDLAGFEALRLFTCGAAWTAGPWLGVKLSEWLFAWAPFVCSSLLALALLACFLAMRLPGGARSPRVSPVAALGRFFRQPRLRLAWSLALGRSAWWVVCFTYGPIFLTSELGFDDSEAGLIASIIMGVTFLVPLWGLLGRRIGLRRLLAIGYTACGAVTLLLTIVHHPAWLAAFLLVAAGTLASMIDGAGNVPFLRAVRPRQRAEMTAVFITYRDVSQLLPPGIFAVLLAIFPLSSIFGATGLAMLALAGFCRHLPRRL